MVLSSASGALVYKARDKILGEEVTVKTVSSDHVRHEMLPSFHRDLKIISGIEHDCIARVLDYGQTRSGKPYAVLEYIDGPSLKDCLKERGPLPPEIAIGILKQLLDGLSLCHAQGVIHRDLKPSNIFLVEAEGEAPIPVLVDFGFGHIRLPDERGMELSPGGDFAGVPEYMNPEQINGQEEDGGSDIYSLGCVFYEMLTGNPPQCGNTAEEIFKKHLEDPFRDLQNLEGFPAKSMADLNSTVGFMLSKDNSNRARADADLASALTGLLPQKKSLARDSVSSKPFNLLGFSATTIAIAILLIAGSFILNSQYSQERQKTDRPITANILKRYIEDKDIKTLDLRTLNISDEDIASLKQLHSLESLSLGGKYITVKGLEELLRLPSIKEIRLQKANNVTEENCAELNAHFGREIVVIVD